MLWHCWLGGRKNIWPVKNMGEWWRWALVSLDGVAPSRMVNVSASVNLPLHHKAQALHFSKWPQCWVVCLAGAHLEGKVRPLHLTGSMITQTHYTLLHHNQPLQQLLAHCLTNLSWSYYGWVGCPNKERTYGNNWRAAGYITKIWLGTEMVHVTLLRRTLAPSP